MERWRAFVTSTTVIVVTIAALAACGDVRQPVATAPSSAPISTVVVPTTDDVEPGHLDPRDLDPVHVYGDSISVPGSWATELGWETFSVAGSSYTLTFGPSIAAEIWGALANHVLPDRAVLTGGVNDLVFGATPFRVLTAMFEQARALRARGVEVFLWELLPVGRSYPQLQADIDAVNIILDGQDEFPVIRCSSVLRDDQFADATLVPDERHPSPEGQHRVAECVRREMSEL